MYCRLGIYNIGLTFHERMVYSSNGVRVRADLADFASARVSVRIRFKETTRLASRAYSTSAHDPTSASAMTSLCDPSIRLRQAVQGQSKSNFWPRA